MSEIEIRDAIETDFGGIHEIYAHSVINETASWEYEPPPEHEMINRFKTIKAANYPYLVALKGQKILGFAYVGLFRGREGWRFVCENSVYVHQDARGLGIAKSLMVYLIQECKKRGLKTIMAVIGDSENKASIALHNSLGFKQIGVLEKVGEKFGKILDSVFMQLDIS